jgi:dynein heavy chain
LIELEKRIERNSPDAHPDFRLFITSDPAAGIPVALLQRSLKLTQEPPPGLKALFLRSWRSFDDNTWDASSKQTEMKVTLFALSFFHAIMVERIKFGPQGWNRMYPFNVGDLTCCKSILFNYLESAGTAIPWDDMRYIWGEIMYGGHITDHFDRLLCETYLKKLMNNDLFEGLELYPGFASAPNTTHAKLVEYIEETMGNESPIMFGMHPNAEIGFRTDQSNTMYAIISDLQPKGASGGAAAGGGGSSNDRVLGLIEEISEKLSESHIDMEDLVSRIDDEGGRTPFINVFYQESVYMNTLTHEILKSLEVLTLGLNGELQMSEAMEELSDSLFTGKVPTTWEKLAFASMKPLAGWIDNLMQRLKQVQDWAVDLQVPKVAWITGFFNPQSFLTAILQSQARKNEWALDKVVVSCEVTKKLNASEFSEASREGSYTNGFTMEGARWDNGLGCVSPSLPKEMFCQMPVVLIKAVPIEKAEFKDCFMCPVYKTQARSATYVFQANLKTRQPPGDWVMGGVALLMDIVL